MTASITPENATNKAVTWQVSNSKYASIDQNGKLSLKKAGAGKSVTVTATAQDGSGKSASVKIKIMKHAVKSVKITASKKKLKAGKTIKLKATVKTTGKKANKALQWSSSNTKHATVDKKGKVKARSAGKNKKVRIMAAATDGSNKKAVITLRIQ